MKKINIADLLKDCPSGMELNCTSYDNVSFDKISDDKKATYPIFCYITDKEGNRSGISFTENGCESKRYGSKCVIFPKDKTTWEGFHRPLKDGDVVTCRYENGLVSMILKKFVNFVEIHHHCALYDNAKGFVTNNYIVGEPKYTHLATEEEKQKLFDAIKANGYKWNPETKTLVRLVTNRFDITTLVPFKSRVLVRDYDNRIWFPMFWGKRLEDDSNCRYLTTNGCYKYCIPYEGNEHLLGTTNDCDEYYKTWE